MYLPIKPKGNMFFAMLFYCFLLLTMNACDKEKEKIAENQSTTSAQSTKVSDMSVQDVKSIASDPEWLAMIEGTQKYANRMLSYRGEMRKLAGMNKFEFCETLNISPVEFDSIAMSLVTASESLNRRYQLESLNVMCKSCLLSDDEKLKQITQKLEYFKANPKQLDAFYAKLKQGQGTGSSGSGSNGPNCGPKFYACVALCAATIEVFPAYLLCCAFCMEEYCTNPPWNK